MGLGPHQNFNSLHAYLLSWKRGEKARQIVAFEGVFPGKGMAPSTVHGRTLERPASTSQSK